MPRYLIAFLVLLAVSPTAFGAAIASPFPVAPHNNVTIEWWYVNAQLNSSAGRSYAVVASFFRFGNGQGLVAEDSKMKVKQSCYLIFGVTDIVNKTHVAYSYGDKNTLDLLQQAAAMMLAQNPDSSRAKALESILANNTFPPPTKLINGQCTITASPFAASYGPNDSISAVRGTPNMFDVKLGDGSVNISMLFQGLKRPMLVNGDGNTGLRVRSDMKYVSLTHCKVKGIIDTGQGKQAVSGSGWFDHQWGNSWTTQSAGWDWWGVQLANNSEVLLFQQINLKTGVPFFPCATFESADGTQTTTHNIVFNYDPASEWTSPHTGVTYPLKWTITFPDQKTSLVVTPDLIDQEMPVLANGGAIWEGSCTVAATVGGIAVPGLAYQELVGYNSRAVHAALKPMTGN